MEENMNFNNTYAEEITLHEETKEEKETTKRGPGRPKKESITKPNETEISSVTNSIEVMPKDNINIEWYACDLKTTFTSGYLHELEPDRDANSNLYKELSKSYDSIIPLLLKSTKLNYKTIPITYGMIITSRFTPIAVSNLLTIEVSGPGTGKTVTLSNLGKFPLISKEPSNAVLTGDQRKSNDSQALIKQLVLQIDEAGNIPFSSEIIGIIKSITSQLSYSSNGKDSTPLRLSLIFTGNPDEKYFNSGEDTLNIELCTKDLKTLSRSLVENFDPALIHRAVIIPGFLLPALNDNYIIKTESKIPDTKLKTNAPAEFKVFEKMVLNVNTLWKTLLELRSEKTFFISEEIKNQLKDTSRRSIEVTEKLYSALKRIYDPSNSYSKEKDLGLQELAVTYRNYASGYYKPLNKGYTRYLLLDIAKMIIEKQEIEEAYIYNHRILLKPVGENKFYKVALDMEGQSENKKEFEFYNSCPNDVKDFLLKVHSIEFEGNVLVQDYIQPYSDHKMLLLDINPLKKEIRELKRNLQKQKMEHENFKKQVLESLKELLFQIQYNSETMLSNGKINIIGECVLEKFSDNISEEKGYKEKLSENFPYLDTENIKSYDISLGEELKIINFHSLNR